MSIDRTSWKFGRTKINILMLIVSYKGIGIPLTLICFKKEGRSSRSYRIDLLKRVLTIINPKNIYCLVGDREFMGSDWIKWLDERDIPFMFRISDNSLLDGELPATAFLKKLPDSKKAKNEKTVICGRTVYLSTMKSDNKDEFVTIISNHQFQDPFWIYTTRWQVETFFGCLKKRGFCLEDTHLKHVDRIENLIFVVAIAFCWSHLLGEEKEKIRLFLKRLKLLVINDKLNSKLQSIF